MKLNSHEKRSRGMDLTYLFKGGSSRNIKSDSLRRSLNSSQGYQNHQNLHYDPYGQYDQIQQKHFWAFYLFPS